MSASMFNQSRINRQSQRIGAVANGKCMCPRCKKVWEVPVGETDVACNCHTYCEDGMKPEDCNLISQTPPTGDSYPMQYDTTANLHTFSLNYGDDRTHRVAYCTIHKRYSYKVPILIPFDWQTWLSRRAETKYRQVYQTTGV